MKTPPKNHPVIVIILALVPILANAANLTWDANTALTGSQDGSGTWDTSTANWWNGTADTTWTSATPDSPTFGNANGVAGTVALGANIVSANVTFNAASVGNYTIAGGGFFLGLTNRVVTPNIAATISAPILGGSLTLDGPGILTLSATNGYTGGTSLETGTQGRGTIRAAASYALGTGTVTVGGGGNSSLGQLQLAGGVTITNFISSAGQQPTIIPARLEAVSGANTYSGLIQLNTGGGDNKIQSDVANGLTLSGATGLNGAAVQGGGSARNLVLLGEGSGTISGVISNGSGANSIAIIKAGSGTWTLSGANVNTVGTVVNAGTLALDYTSQNNSKIADAAALTLAGGTVNLNAGSHVELVSATTIAAGGSAVTRNTGTSTLRLNAISRNRGGTVNFGAASITDTDTLNVNGILGGYATLAGADWAMNSTGAGDGPITAYTGYTDIAATGSTIADGATSNVRLNSAGGGGNIALGSTTTTVQTLLQNTATAATIDTASRTLRLGTNGGVLIPATAQSLTFGTVANSGTLTAGGSDNTAGEIILINNSANALTVNAVVADNGTGPVSLTKSGTGSATLAGNNTHTGTNSIVGGTLRVDSDANFGTDPGSPVAGKILINGGVLQAGSTFTLSANRGIQIGTTVGYGSGTIDVAGGATLTYSGVIANAGGAGTLFKTGAGTLSLGGANTYTFGTVINGGTLSISADSALGNSVAIPTGESMPGNIVLNGGTLSAAASFTLSANRGIALGPVTGSGGGSIGVASGSTLTLPAASIIADNGGGTGSLTKTDDGTLILNSINSYSGDTTVSAGTLQLNNSRSIPNGAGKGNVTVNGTLNLNGNNVQINGLSGGSTALVDNTTATPCTFGVGNNNQTSSFGGSIQNSGGGPLALSKVGAGTLTLSGNINHNGSTFINAGTLALSGSATMGNTTNIAVSSGATFDVSGLTSGTLALNSGQTLSGNGTVLGTINVGAGAVGPGASAGTLSVANLTLSTGSQLNYELANVTTTGTGVNDYLVVSGTLNVAGATTLNLSYLNGIPASSGKYTLIQYGIFAGDVNNISVPPGFTIANNTVAKTIELLINHVPTSLVWLGDGTANVWDIDSTPNWTGGAVFFNGDSVSFDNTGSASPAINITVPVFPAAVNVSGSQNYDFTSSSISGASLNKSGSGTLTLENDNTFVTGVSISGGTVQIGNAGSTGTLTGGNITNNGAIVVNRSGDVLLGSAISGSGSVSQLNSAGTTALTASNSYSGATFVTAGRLYARNGSAFGDTSSGTTVSSGAQIYMDVNVSFPAEPLTLNGGGLASDGALRKGGAGVTAFGGPLTLGSDTTISIDGGATLNLTNASGITSSGASLVLDGGGGSSGSVSGPINLAGGAGVLAKSGTGSWTLGGANSMSLSTVTNGTLILANNNALGTNLDVTLTSTTGGAGISGTRLTLSSGITIPANRTLHMSSSGAGSVRTAFVGTGAGTTNTWNGPVLLTGDSTSGGNVINWGADANSTFVINGNVTSDSTFLAGKLICRGNATGTGIFNSAVALDPANGQFQIDDGSTWVFNSTANTWLTTIFAGSSTLRIGANNALPTSTLLTIGNGAANRFDLAGFNQQVAGLEMGPGLTITNTSPTTDSTLTFSSASSSTFGGVIGNGTRKLNLTIAAGTLILTNPASLNLNKSTVSIAGGGPLLQLDYVGTNTVNALVLNGTSQPAGIYNVLNAAPYITGVGNLLVQPGPSTPAHLTNSVSGGTLTLSWPAGQGWRLQAQTNNLNTGITTNWVFITDDSVNSTNLPINPANPSVFYRLAYPQPPY